MPYPKLRNVVVVIVINPTSQQPIPATTRKTSNFAISYITVQTKVVLQEPKTD